ncbi:uncharacterized protein [Euwallacea fornicatus]|uniref:uncharacterized protein n=1 Tax=Euwallacea fornicatus TaxID=995702 RepID=UPI0033901C32
MPGTFCSVMGCESKANVARKMGYVLRFFSFPKNPSLRHQWLRLCYRPKNLETDRGSKKVCSKHFHTDQFEDEIEARIKGILPKRLKKNAIPTLNLPNLDPPKVKLLRTKKIEERKRREVVNRLLDDSNSVASLRTSTMRQNVLDENILHKNCGNQSLNFSETPYQVLSKKFEDLKKLYDELKVINALQKSTILRLSNENFKLSNRVAELNKHTDLTP